MKKIIIPLFTCFVLASLGVEKGFAVWVPSTSLETATVEVSTMTAAERLHATVQKLEDDERRLAAVLESLKKEQEALRKSK